MRSDSYFKSFQKNPETLSHKYQHNIIPWPSWSAFWLNPAGLPLDLKSLFNCVCDQAGPQTGTPKCGSRTYPTNSLHSHSRWAAELPESPVLAHTLLIWLRLLSHTASRKQCRTRDCLTLALHVNPQYCAPDWT